jgi:hypothetical protein
MLTAFVEDAELATLTPQTIPQDFSYPPELDAEDDAGEYTPRKGVRFGIPSTGHYTAEECAAEAEAALLDEKPEWVDRQIENVARKHMTPSVVYDFCHEVLTCEEFGSRSRLRGAEYRADLHLAAKRSLRDEPVLWQLHQMIQDGAADGIPAWAMVRSPLMQQCKYLVGAEYQRRNLHNTSWYFSNKTARTHGTCF